MKLSDTEWIVMNAVWEAAAPVSARDVLDSVESAWAYTTVKTLLSRLAEKGVVSENKRANTNYYEALITRDQARGDALHLLVDKAFDGTIGSLLQHMVSREKLSKRDKERLAELMSELDAKGRNKK